MERYNEEDLENFERDCLDHIICPSGDYTVIKDFPDNCVFESSCLFGNWSNFGKWCSFGGRCIFGELSKFGEKCNHEGLTNSIYVAIDRIGSELRKTYFFKAEEGYFVRAGCFFGTLDEFKTKLNETHGDTIHETTYLMACDLAVKLLDFQWKK